MRDHVHRIWAICSVFPYISHLVIPDHIPLLRESINDLKEKGTLTEDDIKNIDSYMIKEREVKEKEIKEKIYNDECEKIDKMVSNKIITKEKGEKLKVEVKENLQQMKRHMKRNNK